MEMNRKVALIIIITSIGCSNADKDKGEKINTSLSRNEKIEVEIDRLVKSTNLDSIKKGKNKLDSILNIIENKNEGYYYFRRAECYTSLELFQESNLDLKQAKEFNYLPERCDQLIKFNEELQQIKNSYN